MNSILEFAGTVFAILIENVAVAVPLTAIAFNKSYVPLTIETLLSLQLNVTFAPAGIAVSHLLINVAVNVASPVCAVNSYDFTIMPVSFSCVVAHAVAELSDSPTSLTAVTLKQCVVAELRP